MESIAVDATASAATTGTENIYVATFAFEASNTDMVLEVQNQTWISMVLPTANSPCEVQ